MENLSHVMGIQRTSQDHPVDWLEVARLLLLSRKLDELEVNRLTPQGKIAYQFSSAGHELAQILLAQVLDHPHDGAAVYYRSRAFMLAVGFTPTEAIAAGMARAGSPSQGRDVGVVYNMPRRGGPTILPSSGDVGAQYTPAAGWAQAILYRQRVLGESDWQGAITAVLGGEGSVASGGFWAALNIAATLNLPLLFLIEDNSYGLSVPATYQYPGGDIAANLSCYGNLRAFSGDGTHPAEAWRLVCQVADHVRSGEGPGLLRLRVPRLAGHTFIDDQAYKPPEIIAEEVSHDPLPQVRSYLTELGYPSELWEDLESEAIQKLETALQEAESIPEPDPVQVGDHLFFQGSAPVHGGLRPEKANIPLGSPEPQMDGPRINLIESVRRTLMSEMRRNPRLLVFGEDVGIKGGVHGVTIDLQVQFGAERVFDTSLNEDGIIGRAVGMALAGLLPVPEIQFRKYADPAHEQISDLGTLRWRTANNFAAPAVVRIPVGFGKKTGDPWHSVSGEAVFAHTLGWRIAYPSNAADACGLLRTALRGDDPTFFLEHRALLDTPEGRQPYPGDEYCLPYGAAARLVPGDELTVVTWGAMVPRCAQAAQDYPGRIDLFDLRTIIPWDQEAILQSVSRTGKLLVVHEDTMTAGFAGEIIATVAEKAFSVLDAPISRLATPDVPIPYNRSMMEVVLPSVSAIRQRMEVLLAF